MHGHTCDCCPREYTHPDQDATSVRLSLSIPGVLGTVRDNDRFHVDQSPLPYDNQFDPLPLSEFPVREARMPIAIESSPWYSDWPDSFNALKHEFTPLYAGGADAGPAPTPEQYGDWLSFDEYRLSFIGARGSSSDA